MAVHHTEGTPPPPAHEEQGLVVWIEEGWGALPLESLANRLTPSVRHQLSSINDEPPSVGRRLQSIVR